MLEYIDEIQHEKLDYIRSISKGERNRIDYYKRLLKNGVEPKQIVKRAKRALKHSNNRDRILSSAKNYIVQN